MESPSFDAGSGMAGRTVVMTGGTGVLGRMLVAALAQAGMNIALIVRDSAKARALFSSDVVPEERLLVVAASVTDSATRGRGAVEGCATVCHPWCGQGRYACDPV